MRTLWMPRPLLMAVPLMALALCLGGGDAGAAARSSEMAQARLSGLVVAGRSWHFADQHPPSTLQRLAIFNPNRSAVVVWIRTMQANGAALRRVILAPERIQIVNLGPSATTRQLSLKANGSIVPQRITWSGTSTDLTFGVPGAAETSAAMLPFPARHWRFAGIQPGPVDVVIVGLYNPNPFAATVLLRLATAPLSRPLHVQIPAMRSEDVNLTLLAPARATLSLTLDSSADIVPQRSVIGLHATNSSYGIG